MKDQDEAIDLPDTPADAVDTARVARLRAAIAAGEYQVDPDAIAERLVEQGFPGDVNPS